MRLRNTNTTLVCQGCGTTFKSFPSQAKSGRKYCTMACYHKHRVPKAWYKQVKRPDGKPGSATVHRILMEQHLGRVLDPWEHVHHKDGNRFNNDISNLEIRTKWEHPSVQRILRLARLGTCPTCGQTTEHLTPS
jgi:hypothetical protein